jgi:hypothetical protein
MANEPEIPVLRNLICFVERKLYLNRSVEISNDVKMDLAEFGIEVIMVDDE